VVHDSHLPRIIKEETVNHSLPKDRIRDSTFPRQPLSAYAYYAKNWNKTHPSKTARTSVNPELRAAWANAPAEERERCESLAKRDNERFKRERDAYIKSQRKVTQK